ncbi:MAG: ABC transporter substrate-binding protein [Pseudomonadota bacterium]
MTNSINRPWGRLRHLAIGLALSGVAVISAAQEVVKLGELDAISGPLATYGWMSHQGIKMAVDEINSAGGFEVAGKKYKLSLTALDNRGQPQEAVIQFKQLLDSNHNFIFGPFLTNIFNAIEPLAKQASGRVLLMGGATSMHAAIQKSGNEHLLRTWNWDAGEEGYGKHMVAYMKSLGVKKVAMLIQNDAFGRVLYDIYHPLFTAQGIQLIVERFEPGTRDYTAVLAKLAAEKPDYLFPGYTDAALNDIFRQATENNFFRKFFLVRGSMQAAMRYKDQVDDVVAYAHKYFEEAEKTEPKVQRFVAAYKAHYKRDFPYDQAPLCSSSCYDHVYMLVEAMKLAQTVSDLPRIRKALLGMTYRGLWTIKYDANGEAIFEGDIVRLRRGGAVTVTKIGAR